MTETPPIIPSIPAATLDEIDSNLRGMFNGHGPRPLEAEIVAALDQKLDHEWTIRPSREVIRAILRRYVDQTPHIANELKLLAYLRATLNSMLPRFFDDHETRWAELKRSSYPPHPRTIFSYPEELIAFVTPWS